jgi:hypothetical protein
LLPPMIRRRVSINNQLKPTRRDETLDAAAYPCTPLTSCNLHHSLLNSSARETTSRHSGNTAIEASHPKRPPFHHVLPCPLLSTRRAQTNPERKHFHLACQPRDQHPHPHFKLTTKQGIRLYHAPRLHHPACPGGAAAAISAAADLTPRRGRRADTFDHHHDDQHHRRLHQVGRDHQRFRLAHHLHDFCVCHRCDPWNHDHRRLNRRIDASCQPDCSSRRRQHGLGGSRVQRCGPQQHQSIPHSTRGQRVEMEPDSRFVRAGPCRQLRFQAHGELSFTTNREIPKDV